MDNEYGNELFFSETDQQVLADTAETARVFLHHNPTRQEFDTWQHNFLQIKPSFDPDDSNIALGSETSFPKDLI